MSNNLHWKYPHSNESEAHRTNCVSHAIFFVSKSLLKNMRRRNRDEVVIYPENHIERIHMTSRHIGVSNQSYGS